MVSANALPAKPSAQRLRALGDFLHRFVVLALPLRLLTLVVLPRLALASRAKELAQLHVANDTTIRRAGLAPQPRLGASEQWSGTPFLVICGRPASFLPTAC